MFPERILVINPNSSKRVTQTICEALTDVRLNSPFQIDVIDIPEAPKGVSLQCHADQVAPLVQRVIAVQGASAYAVACFSDPGVVGAREHAPLVPIRGIGESAVLHALTKGERFGIIALSEKSISRQKRFIRCMGVGERYSGSYAINTSPEESTDRGLLQAMTDAASSLIEDGADVIIMGCAGMAHFQSELQQRYGCPVVEPTKAAVALLIGDIIISA